ncbi:MAG: ribosomal L7Ae/L30e/S12e/Gadd45 family protein [Candidatus Aenigmatarchaeota archaeon]
MKIEEKVSKLPQGKPVIGMREIVKSINSNGVNVVFIASNCPEEMVNAIKSKKVKIKLFDGDQKKLGTSAGKPFPISMVGFNEEK